ncbi:Putative virB2-like protein [Candidatus Phycorickettsia trachydisci]|uniref:VirB2-like protein n=1 Tax=Candidatus Phycorickettsia trachydisci TaxID=2115978 RepID=A0A2P1P6Y7_9RICK|nr:TrbC/VirB2 family protein [Candidatus Phycorickettsia trachydisci]AVP87017.1 Putative virB2-like protein [Candidatus Phycorickettsia trachydisci]
MQYNKGNLALRVLMFIFLSFWIASSANAMGSTASDIIGNNLCTLVKNLTGSTAKAIGVLAMILVSFGVMTGKVNTWTAMSTVIGIFVLFGASSLVLYISGSSTTGCV